MRKDRRDLTAYHEAGHAVVARLQGVEIDAVMMFGFEKTADATVLISDRPISSDMTERIAGIETAIRTGLAGPIASRLYGKAPSRKIEFIASDDVKQAHSMAVEFALLIAGVPIPPPPRDNMVFELDHTTIESANTTITRLQAETKTLLVEHWLKVARVAQALLTCDMLDQTQLDRIMAGG
jgi:hypothetical protein